VSDDRTSSVHVQSLHELGGAFTGRRLVDWARGNPERSAFLGHSVLGSIAWSRALGKPETPTLWEAFEVVHLFCNPAERDCKQPDDWQGADPPEGGDGRPDGERYWVFFVCKVKELFPNKVTVALRDVRWSSAGPFAASRPVVAPDEQQFSPPGDGGAVILEFTLVAPIHFDPHSPVHAR
jgi:hypothetical protein